MNVFPWSPIGIKRPRAIEDARRSIDARNLSLTITGSRASGRKRASSAIDESSQHVTDVILSAEEHCQDAYGLLSS